MRAHPTVVLSLLVLLSLPAAAQTVRVKWERTTDFTKYKTYSWMEGTHDDVTDTTDELIVNYINGQLGISNIFQDDFEPDLYVTYHGSTEESFEVGAEATVPIGHNRALSPSTATSQGRSWSTSWMRQTIS